MKKYVFSFIIPIMVITALLFPPTIVSAKSVPDFSLKQLDGSAYKFSDHVGKKVILIDFWATWCKPCKKFLKKLNAIYKERKDQVEVLAISTDDSSSLARVESYVKSKQFVFTVLLDPDSQVARVFNPSQQLPFTIIIDKKGNIVYSHTGYLPGYEKVIAKKLDRLTNENR
ncbi:MAG: TlpA family protein disulfide reductase [bacterium]|nr:TlpA family protein disulfide reductase [bacterium]